MEEDNRWREMTDGVSTGSLRTKNQVNNSADVLLGDNLPGAGRWIYTNTMKAGAQISADMWGRVVQGCYRRQDKLIETHIFWLETWWLRMKCLQTEIKVEQYWGLLPLGILTICDDEYCLLACQHLESPRRQNSGQVFEWASRLD